MKRRPKNYPREEIMEMANKAIAAAGGPGAARVYFKFTCAKCGNRCQFTEPNKLYERGVCCECGTDQPVTEAGFSLALQL